MDRLQYWITCDYRLHQFTLVIGFILNYLLLSLHLKYFRLKYDPCRDTFHSLNLNLLNNFVIDLGE